MELYDKESVIRRPATSADVKLSLEDHSPLVQRAEALLLGSLRSSFVKRKVRLRQR